MSKGFVIEFSAVTWFSDDGDEHNTVHRFRVLVDGESVTAYVAHPGPFADGWARVVGDEANACRADLRSCSWPAPFDENRIIALAFVLHQELGGVGVTLLVLAAAAGLSADEEEAREVARVLSKPVEEFTRRNAAKNEAGLLARQRTVKVPFAIEFDANEWDAGAEANPNATRQTYRVLVDGSEARAFVAAICDFGRWSRVPGDEAVFRQVSPLTESQVIALALRGYHTWWLGWHHAPTPIGWGELAENGIPVFRIGVVKREP